MNATRAGAALVLSLLIMLVLECAVLGTVYLTLQERRLADNATLALRLRLAAESAVTEAAAQWPAALDTIRRGAVIARAAAQRDGLIASATWQRVDSTLVLVFAEAMQPAPLLGRARAARLIEPPLVPLYRLPAATLSTGGTVRVRSGAHVTAVPAQPCPDDSVGSADALRLAGATSLTLDDPLALVGTVAAVPPANGLLANAQRVAAVVPVFAMADSMTGTFVMHGHTGSGVVAVAGDPTIAADAQFAGLVLVTGAISVEPGAIIDGVIVAGGDVDIAGTLRLSRCAAVAAVRTQRLHFPRPHARRHVIPAF
jgi:hypothetical protein